MRKGWKKRGNAFVSKKHGMKLLAYQWHKNYFTGRAHGKHAYYEFSWCGNIEEACEFAESMADAHQTFLNRMKYQRKSK